MPSPQIEDGHTDIANELVEQFCKLRLNTVEWMVLWAVIRKTWGWHKKSDKTSLTQFQELTGLSRPSVVRGIDKLVSQMILVKDESGYINSYRINKDYSKWKSSNTGATSSIHATSNTGATKVVTPVQPKLVAPVQHTKETKEKIQKKEKTTFQKTLAAYAVIKKIKFDNKKQQNSFYKRYGRASSLLKAYPIEHIILTMSYLEVVKSKEFKWTLETVGKYIDEIRASEDKFPPQVIKLARQVKEICEN